MLIIAQKHGVKTVTSSPAEKKLGDPGPGTWDSGSINIPFISGRLGEGKSRGEHAQAGT